ncbi:MAG: TIGR02147 family protein [Fibrobacteria bacterium]|nr:TIGR02147 family protein [Fibrobacteria bacterium]
MNLFRYLDYRDYLKDFYQVQKREHNYFSYRYMGRKLELDPGYLVHILNKKHHLSDPKIPNVIKLCKLTVKEGEYFETLVRFGKSKSEKETRIFFEKLVSLRQVDSLQMDERRYEFYTRWHYSAIRALLDCLPFTGDYKALGKLLDPPISEKEAKKSVSMLKNLKLVQEDEQGNIIPTEAHITTGTGFHSQAVRTFQADMINLARESIERYDKNLRDITTLTVSLDKEAVEDIREMADKFFNEVKKRIDEVGKSERVYQINIQMFPLSKNIKTTA